MNTQLPEVDRHHTGSLPVLVDIEAVANCCGVGVRHVRRLVAERRIPFVKVGRHVRFDVAEVIVWIDEHRTEMLDRGTVSRRGR